MNYGSEPADQVVRYSLEGAEFALRISGTAAKNFFIFAQAVLHDSKKTHGKTHLIRLLKEQKPLKFFTVDKNRMHDFARAAKAHGLLFCPIRDKMDPDHIEIAILQDDASKANRIIEKLQLDVVDTGTAELVDAVQQNLENAAPNHEDTHTVDFPLGSENASPSEPFSDSSKSFANSPSPRADQLRAKGERPSVRRELRDITAYLRNREEAPKDRMPKLPVKIRRNGSYSINHQQSGRDLMTPDEVRLLDNSKCILFIRGELPVVDYKYNLLKHPNIRYTEDGGAAPYDYTAADNARDDLPGAPENYELLDMDDFLPAEVAEMKPTIQRIRRST